MPSVVQAHLDLWSEEWIANDRRKCGWPNLNYFPVTFRFLEGRRLFISQTLSERHCGSANTIFDVSCFPAIKAGGTWSWTLPTLSWRGAWAQSFIQWTPLNSLCLCLASSGTKSEFRHWKFRVCRLASCLSVPKQGTSVRRHLIIRLTRFHSCHFQVVIRSRSAVCRMVMSSSTVRRMVI
jgi:hypothetical protein